MTVIDNFKTILTYHRHWADRLWRIIIVLQVLHSCLGETLQFSISMLNGRCHKNISVKYHVPVTRTRISHTVGGLTATSHQPNEIYFDTSTTTMPYERAHTEQYVDYEERIRWDTIRICCPGYQAIVLGLCVAKCSSACPMNSYCIEPERCACIRGYVASHHTSSKQQYQLLCRPNCKGGCPEHSHCVGHNRCRCRIGYRDTSNWFESSLHCERWPCPNDQHYNHAARKCVRIARTTESSRSSVASMASTEKATFNSDGDSVKNVFEYITSTGTKMMVSMRSTAPITSSPTNHLDDQKQSTACLERLMQSVGKKLAGNEDKAAEYDDEDENEEAIIFERP